MKNTFVIAMLLILIGNQPTLAQKEDTATKTKTAEKAKQKRTAPNLAFAKIIDTPGLPRVLLIGDSITIGYTLEVRELLKDQANVHRIPTNGGPTTNGLKNLQVWLGDSKWDVIHFNWGLHDLKYVGADGVNLSDPKAAGSHPQVGSPSGPKAWARSPPPLPTLLWISSARKRFGACCSLFSFIAAPKGCC